VEVVWSSGMVATLAWEAAALYWPWVIMMGEGVARGRGAAIPGLGIFDWGVLALF